LKNLAVIKNRILFALILFIGLFAGGVNSVCAQYVPPKAVGYVNDFAKVLTQENLAKLNGLLLELKSKTGAEVAVVTLSSLDGYPIEDVGLEIGRKWKIGQKGKNNGLVIVVAPNDRKMRIEVGYGLEGILTDSGAGRIRDEYMVPYFKQGDYQTGIINGTSAVVLVIAKGYGVDLASSYALPQPTKTSEGFDIYHLLLFIFIIFLFIKYPSFMFGVLLGSLLGGGRSSGGSSGGFGGFSGGGGFGGGGSSGGW